MLSIYIYFLLLSSLYFNSVLSFQGNPNSKGLLLNKASSITHKTEKNNNILNNKIMVRMTAKASTTSNDVNKPSVFSKILAGWGVVGVIGILANALRRVIPIAMQPFKQGDLTPFQLGSYVAWGAYMLYVEGYKAFQLKFCPLVVRRAFTLSENPGIFNWILAGPYSMGLFNATKKRLIVSWGISIGVLGIVAAVKRLAYPWRSIIDGGVVLGLSYGAASLCFQFIKAIFTNEMPDIDPCLPVKNKKE